MYVNLQLIIHLKFSGKKTVEIQQLRILFTTLKKEAMIELKQNRFTGEFS